MAQEKEDEILIEVNLDEAATEKRITDLKMKIMSLRQAKKDLAQEFKDGKITSEQYNAAIVKNESATRALSKEVQSNQKALDLNDKATKAATGSLNQMRAQLAQYKDLIGNLTAEERASKAGKKLIRDTDALNSSILEVEKSYGQFGRQVGNYALMAGKAVEEQAPLIGQLKTIHSTLKDGIGYLKENHEQWIDNGKAAKESLVSTIKLLVGAKQTQEQQDKAIKLSSISITSFGKAARVALAATGIGILVLAFGALIGFLTKTQAGMDFIERKTKGVSAVFNFLAQGLYSVGEVMVNIWRKPGEAAQKFVDFLQQNLINRVKGFAVILKAIGEGNWAGMVDGVVQVGTGITDASKKVRTFTDDLANAQKAGEAVARESQRIRDEEIKLNTERRNSRATIERLKMIADDTTKSTKERIDAARQAGKMETDLLAKQEKLQIAKIKNIKEENRLNGNTVADKQKLADAEGELGDIREDSFGKQTEVQNTLNGLVQEGKEKAIEAAKEILNAQIANNELRLRTAQKIGKDTLAIEEQLIRQRAELEKKDLKNKDQKRAVDLKAEADIADLRVAQAVEEQNRFFRTQASGVSARLALVKKGTQEEADLIKEQITNQAIQERLAAGLSIKNAEELSAKIAEIDANEKAQKLVVDANLKAQLAQNDVTAIQARLNVVSEGSDAEFELRKELLDAQKDAELAVANLTEEQKKEIRTRYAREQTVLDNERLVRQKNDAVVGVQARLNTAREGSKAEFELRKELLNKQKDAELAVANLTANQKKEIETRYAKAQTDLTKQYLQEMADLAVSSLQHVTSTLSLVYDAQASIQQQALDKQEKAALKSAGSNAEMREKIESQFLKRREELEEKANKKKKAIARAEAAINTAVAATKALTSGPIIGPIMAALIVAQGLAQQTAIDAQKFAQGGYVSDQRGAYVTGPGTGKSDSIPARISNGEAVVNARSTQMYYDELSAINVAGGGRQFPGAISTTIPHFNMGGVALQTDSAGMVDAFKRALLEMPHPIVAVTDIQRKSSEMKRVEARGKF